MEKLNAIIAEVAPSQLEKAKFNPEKAWEILKEIVSGVNNQLIDMYGKLRTDTWEPTSNSITFHTTEGYFNSAKELQGDEFAEHVRKSKWHAFTTVPEPRVIAINLDQVENPRALEMLLGEEILHAWGLQKPIDFSEMQELDDGERNIYGVAAMETIVTFLAYKALCLFDRSKDEIPESMKADFKISSFLTGNIDILPNGEALAFKLCLIGKNEELDQLIDKKFDYVSMPEEDDTPHIKLYYGAAVCNLRDKINNDTELARYFDQVIASYSGMFFLYK